MRRRDFVTLLGGAAATSPVAAVAQLPGEMRRVALLIPYPPTDPDIQDWMRALRDELARLGWVRGWNLEFDERWTGDNMDLIRSHSANIVELKPNAIVASGGRVVPILLGLTRTIPIINPLSAILLDTSASKRLRGLVATTPDFRFGRSQFSARCSSF